MVEAMRKWVIVMVAVGCWLAISLTGGQRAQAEQAASSASAKKAAPRASMKKATKRSMSAMFARLPAGANTLLAADLDAIKFGLTDPLLRGESRTPDIDTLVQCLLRGLGPEAFVVASSDQTFFPLDGELSALTVRSFIAGLTLPELAACLAALPLEKSRDGKHLSLELPGMALSQLAVDGGVYSVLRIDSKAMRPAAARAELELEVQSLARTNTANDVRFSDLISRLDPTKDFWLFLPTANTRWQAKFASMFLEMSFRRGLSLTLAIDAFSAARAAQMPRVFSFLTARMVSEKPQTTLMDSLRAIAVTSSGPYARFSLERDRAQLETLIDHLDDFTLLADLLKQAAEEPERFTHQQVAAMISAMQKCEGDRADPRARLRCACRSDLALSNAPRPTDLAAHCAAYTKRIEGLAQVPAQRRPHELAAPDVGAGTLMVATYAEACAAHPSRKKADCTCLVKRFANRMAEHQIKTLPDLLSAMEQVQREIENEGLCLEKRP